MPTLKDRHADALTRAMDLSRKLQTLTDQTDLVRQEMLKVAGQIDLLEALMKESPDGV